jgi:hypothetical protein
MKSADETSGATAPALPECSSDSNDGYLRAGGRCVGSARNFRRCWRAVRDSNPRRPPGSKPIREARDVFGIARGCLSWPYGASVSVPAGTPWTPSSEADGRPESCTMDAGILPRIDLTALPDEVKELVRAQLETGRFQSVDEVVVEALPLLQEREELFASHRDELRLLRRPSGMVGSSPSVCSRTCCARSSCWRECQRWVAIDPSSGPRPTVSGSRGRPSCLPSGRPAAPHRSDRARFARLEWFRDSRLTCLCVAPRVVRRRGVC